MILSIDQMKKLAGNVHDESKLVLISDNMVSMGSTMKSDDYITDRGKGEVKNQ